MKQSLRKPILLFLILVVIIALPLFLLPLNIFDGEIVYHSGISTIVEPRPLSLHFVSGIEYSGEKLAGVKDYYLTAKGMTLAILFIFGIPALITYRIFLKKDKK